MNKVSHERKKNKATEGEINGNPTEEIGRLHH
jgi:hypothetical protein